MQKSTSGFTIVELIIVIVVIGIIAAIALVSYNGIQRQTLDSERIAELRGWKATFDKYKAANGQYPVVDSGAGVVTYCLGTDFPNQKCQTYQPGGPPNEPNEISSAAMMNELAPYDPPKTGPRTPAGYLVGPWAEWTTSYIRLVTAIDPDSDCPKDIDLYWTGTSSEGVKAKTCRLLLRR